MALSETPFAEVLKASRDPSSQDGVVQELSCGHTRRVKFPGYSKLHETPERTVGHSVPCTACERAAADGKGA